MGFGKDVVSPALSGRRLIWANLPIARHPGLYGSAPTADEKGYNVMSDQCHNLANEIRLLIKKIPPPDIPLLIREMFKRQLMGCEHELGAAEPIN
jgi:hypothetical protein